MESQVTIGTIVFIVSLIVPGVIFKKFYYLGPFTKQFGAGLFADRLITSIFWGIVVQIITFLIFSKICKFSYTDISTNIGTDYTQLMENKVPNETYFHLTYILYYLISLVVVACILGATLHNIIRILGIDTRFAVLRFSNNWHYYFRGDILKTREFRELKKGKWLSTMVDVVIEDGTDKNKMISGLLSQYTISEKTGDLETIYLTSASKFLESSREFKDIPGEMVVVPFDRVIDMNIRYNRLDIVNEESNQIFNRLSLIGFLLMLGIFAYPWYLNLSLIRKIILSLTSSAAWLFVIILIVNPFQTKPNSKMNREALIGSFIFFVFFICLSVWASNIL